MPRIKRCDERRDDANGNTANGSPCRYQACRLQGNGEHKRHLSITTLKKTEGPAWTLEASGPSVEELRHVLERFTETRKTLAESGSAPEISPADALEAMLMAEGFTIERLPAGDHQLNFQIDLQTGRIVGTHEAMHPLASADDEVGRRVFEAIAGGLSKFGDELADEIEKRLAENDANGAVPAIKHGLDNGLFGLRLSQRLLNALKRIDVSGLSAQDRRHVRDSRLLPRSSSDNSTLPVSKLTAYLWKTTGHSIPDKSLHSEWRRRSGLWREVIEKLRSQPCEIC